MVEGSTGFKYVLEKNPSARDVWYVSGDIPVYWQYFHSFNATTSRKTTILPVITRKSSIQLIMRYRDEFDIETKRALSRQISKRSLMRGDCARFCSAL
ncbi:hypothetical protein [Vibrio stylophorae]|uniref:hypothetical protein n=1 Tax=Vibrio stylophorae TaxID=659351 RepID=UPI001F2B384A|nr:hypothetical protein [Vibrio stylophorae]